MSTTHMRQEIEEIPAAVARLLYHGADELAEAGARLRAARPAVIATIARGSSDHAASFLKYAFELVAGIPVASIGPSVASVYGRELNLANGAAIAVSQSGKSPDIVSMAESARRNGAMTIALTNTPNSPLATASSIAIDLRAGEEKSVAATQSFVNSVVAGLALVAHASENGALHKALAALPRPSRPPSHAIGRHCSTALRVRPLSTSWAAARPRHRAGGRAQVQGDLRFAC